MTNDLAATEQRSSFGQLVRYGLVGLAGNLAGYLLYLLITYLGVEPKLAMSLLYLIVASINFIGNRQWTFTHKGALLGSGSRYLIAHAFGYVLNFFILLVFVDMLGYPHQWVQAVAIFVVAGFLFVSLKLFVFPASPGYGRAIEK